MEDKNDIKEGNIEKESFQESKTQENNIKEDNKPNNNIQTKKNNLGTTSMICGLISLIIFWLPPISFILAITSIIIGIIGLSKKVEKGLSITGIILSSITILIYVVLFGAVISDVIKNPDSWNQVVQSETESNLTKEENSKQEAEQKAQEAKEKAKLEAEQRAKGAEEKKKNEEKNFTFDKLSYEYKEFKTKTRKNKLHLEC